MIEKPVPVFGPSVEHREIEYAKRHAGNEFVDGIISPAPGLSSAIAVSRENAA
jgi:hypothetical protein